MDDLLLVISLGGARVAIPARDVESVVELEGLTPVPRSPPHVAGLSALRSRVLTVIDCRASLGLGGTDLSALLEAIVVARDGHPYALLVDGVEDVVAFSGDIQPVRGRLDGGWAHAARGIVTAGDDLLLLIDTETLIAGIQSRAA